MSHIADMMPNTLEEIEAIGIGTSIGKYRIPTGFDDLDGLIGGWSPPSLVVIGGRPASGKTSLMLHIARNASATHNITSMFVSSEESKNEIISRFLASAAKVPLLYMRGGQMSDEDWGNLAKGMIAASDAPFILNSCASLSLDEIAQEAGSIFDQSKVGALFIDGLLSFVDRDSADYSFTLKTALLRLKRLARILNIVTFVSVPSIRPDDTSCKIDATMLAESTEIERAADIIIVLDRPDQDDRETPRAGEADLCVVKNKFGPEAVITVAWQSHYTRFIDLSVNAYPIFTRKKKTANSEQEDEQNWDTIDSPDSFLSDDPVAEGFPKDADKL